MIISPSILEIPAEGGGGVVSSFSVYSGFPSGFLLLLLVDGSQHGGQQTDAVQGQPDNNQMSSLAGRKHETDHTNLDPF
jgi:hypothetical protein